MSDSEFRWFGELLTARTGIAVPDTKRELVSGRLARRLRGLKLPSYGAYLKLLKRDRGSREMDLFINALTTNMTSFFREPEQLTALQSSCKGEFRGQKVYVWSAACSTGEEVYSAGMCLEENRRKVAGFDYRILGSDIDTHCLARARSAYYGAHDVARLPPGYVDRYLVAGGTEVGREYRVGEQIRSRTKFKQINLLSDGGRSLRLSFHFIYLRNVLIYFQEDTIREIVRNLERRLKPGGILFVGASETIDVSGTQLRKVGGSTYQKRGHTHHPPSGPLLLPGRWTG